MSRKVISNMSNSSTALRIVRFFVLVLLPFLFLCSCGSEPVDVAYDATRFIVEENGEKRPITEEELIELIGEPEGVEEWNYEGIFSTYPMRSLSYHEGKYVYEFNGNHLMRIQILSPVTFDKKDDILARFGLKEYSNTSVTDTEWAYRVYNCGVHDLWCMEIDDGTIGMTYITYSNLFEQ